MTRDSKAGQAVMKILQTLNDQGVTIILVTHEKNTALHGKRMLRMQDGKLIEDSIITNRILANQEKELAK
jgi:putative ABC transport system ATP-binding protein